MLEKITFRLFLTCLFGCASLVLSIIWGGPPAEVYFRITATLFVVGLGSFLTWFSMMLYSIRTS